MRPKVNCWQLEMNKTIEQARLLVVERVPEFKSHRGVGKVLCPPATDLMAVSAMLVGTDISLGAQNMYWEASGALYR